MASVISPSRLVTAVYLFTSVACLSFLPINVSTTRPQLIQLLALKPITYPLLPWTWLSFPSVDTSPLLLVLGSPCLYLSLRYFERIWTARGVYKFLAGTTLASSACIIGFSWIVYCTLDLLLSQVHGVLATLSSLVVAYKQTVPEHVVTIPLVPGFRVKHIPFAWLFIHTSILVILGQQYWSIYLLILSGFVSGWWYLRFVRIEDGIRGDRSDAFAFVAFFPDRIQPLFRPILNTIFTMCVVLRLISPTPTRVLELNTRHGRSSSSRGISSRRFVASAPKPVLPVAAPVKTGLMELDRRK